MKALSLVASLAYLSTLIKSQSLSECLSGEDAVIDEDISTLNWSQSYRMRLDAGDSCYYMAFMTSKVEWADDAFITVKTQTYRHPVGSETEC